MEDINNTVNLVKQATNYQTNKKILREKILGDLHLAYNGGMFKITTDLIAFLATWPNDQMFLEDIYQNPIQINRLELLEMAQQHYHKVMNFWHQEHEQLKSIRKI